jgi:hypothetical protein
MSDYSISKQVTLPFEEAVSHVKQCRPYRDKRQSDLQKQVGRLVSAVHYPGRLPPGIRLQSLRAREGDRLITAMQRYSLPGRHQGNGFGCKTYTCHESGRQRAACGVGKGGRRATSISSL